jgi:hypothetical protein
MICVGLDDMPDAKNFDIDFNARYDYIEATGPTA